VVNDKSWEKGKGEGETDGGEREWGNGKWELSSVLTLLTSTSDLWPSFYAFISRYDKQRSNGRAYYTLGVSMVCTWVIS